jgi:hypothetical protein
MELTIKIEYSQILKLIHQLPRKDIEKLATTLQKDLSSKKSVQSIQDLILLAPTWSKSDLNDFQEARESINKSRIA